MNHPQFPLYIPSKGRHETRHTARALMEMGVDFRIVVEEQERELYEAVIPTKHILTLDPQYQRDYDTFDDLDETVPKGSGPARNFIWDHSVERGFDWHWIMDDNIRGFYRLHKNRKIPCGDGTPFKVMEDFILRYTNVGMAGPNYYMFAPRKVKKLPITMNTRIYSCNLIRNDLPFRWRGRYNEDTDLSLRMLKAGWCTVLINAFLQQKISTQLTKGGNTDTIYKHGTKAKSEMQVAMHPDVSRLMFRFKRAHHFVDYSGFKDMKLSRRKGLVIEPGSNDYGLKLRPKSG